MRLRDGLVILGGAVLIALGLLLGRARGTDIPLPAAFNTAAGTVLAARNAGVTNSANTNGAAFWVEPNLYHTFIITTSCTNAATTYLDRSLDQISWIPFATNAPSSTATNELTMTGKWSYVRGRFTGTNSSATVVYLGGR